jgi:hypothetical protein
VRQRNEAHKVRGGTQTRAWKRGKGDAFLDRLIARYKDPTSRKKEDSCLRPRKSPS